MVAIIFPYIILHVPAYLGKGGSPTFLDFDDFDDRTVLYKFEIRIRIKQWEDPFLYRQIVDSVIVICLRLAQT
jgi:hypothetical protein